MTRRFTIRGNRLAAMGLRITVDVDAEHGLLVLRAPCYRRSIPLADITSVDIQPDDGQNQGLVNWFVTGRASSPAGVRLNNGGTARVDIVTTDGCRCTVVVDTMEQAREIRALLLRS